LKAEKDKYLKREFDRYKAEIIDPKCYKFNRRELEVEISQNFMKDEVIDFYNEYIIAGSPKRKKLSCQVFGKGCDIPETHNGEVLISDDTSIFKRSQRLSSLVFDRNDFKCEKSNI